MKKLDDNLKTNGDEKQKKIFESDVISNRLDFNFYKRL